MKRKVFQTATLLIIIIGIVALVALLWVFRSTPESVGKSKPDIKTDVETMVNDYDKNENEANIKYLNKIIEVVGTVESKDVNGNKITVTLKEQNQISGVICSFHSNSIDTSTVKIGSTLSIIGKCDGYLMDVVLSKCVLNK